MHSDYSLLDSCTKFEDYVDLAVQQGQTAIASTEHGKPMGWVSKKIYCDQHNIKFIHGVEIYVTKQLFPKERDNYHTILLAKNSDGVHELNALVSKSCQEDHFYFNNRITIDELKSISTNIIKLSACLASPLNKMQCGEDELIELAQCYDYLEVQPHKHPDQVKYNKWLSEVAKKIGKPLVACTDTHSLNKYKAECRHIFLEAHRHMYSDEDSFDLTYRTYDRLVEEFEEQGALSKEEYLAAIENTNVIADSIEPFELDTSIKYPILYGSREQDGEVFSELVERKFSEKISSGVIPKSQVNAFRQAIDEEMAVFRKLGMDGFMLSMSELISWCKENDLAIGTARGSVGGSRVAYVSDIIDLNPETWHTVFSRFCNEDRVEIGDIDIDCIESDRPKIFEHIIQKFGADKTARVASFGTAAARNTIGDIGRAFRHQWTKDHPDKPNNPWSVENIDKIRDEFDAEPEATRTKYPDMFYYFDGILGSKVSQSVHPAGMVISPIPLDDYCGVFEKDGERCLMLDMDEVHDGVGLAKYDFLVLKTVQVIRDTCNLIHTHYPRTHEVNWEDERVWKDMMRSPVGIFQMESRFAFDSLKKFGAKNIFDMSLVTAAIRPSGASYRNELLAGLEHHNPSVLIDELLSDNNGYLIYQCDIIKFLQQICGLSGSEADNVRRGIARKKIAVLEQSMPMILEGYCSKSDKPREIAEQEVKEFLQIIEDASSYMFGYNHSIAYCLLGYLCAYYRCYHPLEFITAFLNNAANDDDISNGTKLAKLYGVHISAPKFGISRGGYSCESATCTIAKGLASIKYLGDKIAEELYEYASAHTFVTFMDVLMGIFAETSIDTRQLDNLIKIDFFSAFGNQAELLRTVEIFEYFKRGQAKQLARSAIDGTQLEPFVRKYSKWINDKGVELKKYTLTDVKSLLYDIEDYLLNLSIPDLSDMVKITNSMDILGYMGYTSSDDNDRRKLYIKEIYPLKRKSDGNQFGYSFVTQSIGSGKEARFTVFNNVYNRQPVNKGDVILCLNYKTEGQYFKLTEYKQLVV